MKLCNPFEYAVLLMSSDLGDSLAVHIYSLQVSRGPTSAHYATIAEVHHPAYLSRRDLLAIYGQGEAPAANTASIEAILDRVLGRLSAEPADSRDPTRLDEGGNR